MRGPNPLDFLNYSRYIGGVKERFTSILMLICLASPFGATYLCLQLRQGQIKSDVKHRLMLGVERDELVLLSFSRESAAALNWKKPHEFEFQGQMYDVVDAEVCPDSSYYWCWADHEETELNRKVRDLTAVALGDHPENHRDQTRLIDYFKSLYHAPARPWQTECRFSGGFLPVFPPALLEFHAAPPVPPPQVC